MGDAGDQEQAEESKPLGPRFGTHAVTSASYYCLKQVTRPVQTQAMGEQTLPLGGRSLKSVQRQGEEIEPLLQSACPSHDVRAQRILWDSLSFPLSIFNLWLGICECRGC